MTTKKDKKPEKSIITRPPIVTFVGHIDHGKTTLLDKIRESRVAQGEPGGITQHIGAYKIELKNKKENNVITFIDTPGHAVFEKMRARGVGMTDIVVLVVSAEAGVQEQTKECCQYIKKAGVPFIVAVNKIDLDSANIDKVKSQLSEIGVISEDYGGDVVTVPVSAQTGKGIEELIEMILLVAEMEELKVDKSADLEGVIIESSLDHQKGPLATVLVKSGVLEAGDQIYAGTIPAKVKALTNWRGERVKKAEPSDPVEVLGFSDVPPIGSVVSSQPKKEDKKEEEKDKEKEGKSKIKIILKTDVKGTIEAVKANLPEEVQLINDAVGEVTEKDVFLAQNTNSEIYAFNVKVKRSAVKLAKQSQVKIFQTSIIYELLEEIERRIEEERDPLENKNILGRAEILAEFKIGDKKIAGGSVTEGSIIRGQKIFLERNEKVISRSVLASLKHGEGDIKSAEKGQEFGAVFSPPLDFKKGDVIISYKDEESDRS
jgi:translation initiation factor IF-2